MPPSFEDLILRENQPYVPPAMRPKAPAAPARAARDPGFFDAAGAALRSGVTASIGDAIAEASTLPIRENPDVALVRAEPFDVNDALKDKATKARVDALGTEWLPRLAGARNSEHFNVMLDNFERRQSDAELLGEYGAVGSFAASFAASLVDPIEMAVNIATGGSYKGASILGGIGKGALLAGGANAALMTVIADQDEAMTLGDIALGTLIGAAIGGGIGGVTARSNKRAAVLAGADARINRALNTAFREAGEDIRLPEEQIDFDFGPELQAPTRLSRAEARQASFDDGYAGRPLRDTAEPGDELARAYEAGQGSRKWADDGYTGKAPPLWDSFREDNALLWNNGLRAQLTDRAFWDAFDNERSLADGGRVDTPDPQQQSLFGDLPEQTRTAPEVPPRVSPEVPPNAAPEAAPNAAPAAASVINNADVSAKFTDSAGFFDADGAGASIRDTISQALAAGNKVRYFRDGKPVEITRVGDNGALEGADGNQHGLFMLFMDNNGQTRIEIDGVAKVETIDTPGSPQRFASLSAAGNQVDPGEKFFGVNATLPASWARKLLANNLPKAIRDIGASLIDSVPLADKTATRRQSAENVKRGLVQRFMGQMLVGDKEFPGTEVFYSQWLKDIKGGGLLVKMRSEIGNDFYQEFMDEVGRAVRGATDVSPQAKSAAKSVAKTMNSMRIAAKEAGIEGFDELLENPNYMPRRVNYGSMMDLAMKLGNGDRKAGIAGLTQFTTRAIIAANPDMDPKLAGKLGNAWVSRMASKADGVDVPFLNGISEANVTRLRFYLDDTNPGLVDEVIEHLQRFRKENGAKDAGRIEQAKYRIRLDETFEADINGVRVKFTDLLHNNAAHLVRDYSEQMSGWVSLSRQLGIKSEADLVKWKDDLRAELPGDPRVNDVFDAVDLILNRAGQGFDSETTSAFVNVALKVSYSARMGQAAFAQTEIGNVIGMVGLRTFMQHMPSLRELINLAKTGKLGNELVDELKTVMGVGLRMEGSRGRGGFMDQQMSNHLAEHYNYNNLAAKFRGFDKWVTSAARATSYIGGLGPMTDGMQLMASRSLHGKLAKAAQGTEALNPDIAARLRDAGLTDGEQTDLLANLKQHGEFDKKGILIKANFDKWDPEVNASWQFAHDRLVYKAIQENDIGSGAPWMSKPLVKMLMQFRSFVFNALVKQTIQAAHFRDMTAFKSFAWTLFVGTMYYVTRQSVNPMSEEKRAERLSPAKIAAGALGYTGVSSIIPSVVDTLMTSPVIDAEEGLFAQQRASGLSQSALSLDGTPVVSLLNSAFEAPRGIRRAAFEDDYDFSRKDAERVRKLLPLGNTLPAMWGFELMYDATDLPEESK